MQTLFPNRFVPMPGTRYKHQPRSDDTEEDIIYTSAPGSRPYEIMEMNSKTILDSFVLGVKYTAADIVNNSKLCKSTVRTHLIKLVDDGKVSFVGEKNRLFWKTE